MVDQPLPHSSPPVTAPVNWEQQMVRQSYQACSATLKFHVTKLKSSGVRLWNYHLSKLTLNRKGALFTLSFHLNTSLCVQAIRLSEQIQQVHNEHKSQYISGQLHNTSDWTKLRYRVTTASSKRQIVSEKPASCTVHWWHCTCHLMTTGGRAQWELRWVLQRQIRQSQGQSANSVLNFKAISLNRSSLSLNWMMYPRGWPAAF